jgi:threonine/homoserine/homoserine lactone efflux protein
MMGMTSDSMYAIAAGSAANWIRSRRSMEYIAGSVYIALGAVTALTGRRAH